jgi:hypothetical protein
VNKSGFSDMQCLPYVKGIEISAGLEPLVIGFVAPLMIASCEGALPLLSRRSTHVGRQLKKDSLA